MSSPSYEDDAQVHNLLEALANYTAADSAERAAREAYEGYEWGYHGYSYIEARAKAAFEFRQCMDEYVDSRIQAATGARP